MLDPIGRCDLKSNNCFTNMLPRQVLVFAAELNYSNQMETENLDRVYSCLILSHFNQKSTLTNL